MSASVLRYRKLVTTDLANQAINLAESGTMGHRVQIPMSVDDLNAFFVWDRPAGSDRAVGHFVSTTATGVNFDDILIGSLSKVYTDVDGVTNGLNFSSAILDANTDSRIRLNGNVSANDLCMAYLLYKCYGSSAASTLSAIYNLEDAQQMLSNGTLTLSIHASLAGEEALSTSAGVDKGGVDAMFRDLLAADPMRFFDATGNQIAGLFEVNSDVDATGAWGFVENDKIEMRVQFNFTNSVTRRGVQDSSQAMTSAANAEDVSTIVIPTGSTFIVRLQIVATDTPSGAATKAAASATAISSALAAQVAITQKAASNAAAAQRAATEAMNAAAAQTASATARYQKSVSDNAAQAIAVSNAVAASAAAKASLERAIATGSTQADIQNQRAAAVAAAAAVENAEAIAVAADATMQTYLNAQNSATAALAAAQTAVAAATANVAKANAAASAAALAASSASAAAAANAKAAADAASDPLTKTLTDAEAKILDPQTVISAQAAANALTSIRASAQAAANTASAAAELATAAQVAASQALENAIGQGQTLDTIQMLRAKAVATVTAKANADAEATANTQALLNAARAELAAQQVSATASAAACVLKEAIANADVNSTGRVRSAAASAWTGAQTAYNSAKVASDSAQASLDTAITGGALFAEVQTKRAAALDTSNATAKAKAIMDAGAAALEDATSKNTRAVSVRDAATAARLADSTASTQAALLIKNAVSAANAYQASKAYLANANVRAQAFNDAQIHRNNAKQALDVARASYVISRDALDAAVTAGKTVSQIIPLRNASQAAADALTQAQGVYNSAIAAFTLAEASLLDGIVLDGSGNPTLDGSGEFVLNETRIWDSSANSLLILAANANLISITNAQANSLVLAYITAQAAADVASVEMTTAKNNAEIAAKVLNNAITGGSTLSQIVELRSAAMAAASAAAKATSANNAAKSAASNSLGRILTSGPSYSAAVSILNSMRILQGQAANSARNNKMANALNAAYSKDTAKQQDLTTAEYALYVAEKALADATTGGATQAQIKSLQETAIASAKLKTIAQQAAVFSKAALDEQLEWAQANFSIDSTGAQTPSNYTVDASGLAVLTASITYARAAAESARCNSLVRQYILMLSGAKNATTATYAAQATVDTATAALDTAITQGAELGTLQTLRANLQNLNATLAAAKAAENLAVASKNSSYATLTERNATGSYINAGAVLILTNAAASQQTAIDHATANSQVDAYVAAFSKYQQELTAWQTAQSAQLLAARNLDIAITSGADVVLIQGLRAKASEANTALAVAVAKRDSAESASLALRMSIETGTRDSSGVMLASAQIAMNLLTTAQLAQEAAIANAQSNSLARIYFQAAENEIETNVALTAAQAEYDVAAELLDQAITGGATIAEIQVLRSTAQTAGNKVSTAQSTATAAGAAKAQAAQGVNADQNALDILNNLQLYQANKISFAKANALLNTADDAKEAAAVSQNNYNLAVLAQGIAATALDTAIASGANITEIQSLRETSVAAAAATATQMIALNLSNAAALQARTAAAADPLATAILDAAAQFDKLVAARTVANSALIVLTGAQTTFDAATAQATLDKTASDLANTTLSYATLPYNATILPVGATGNAITASPLGGKTAQEVTELRAVALNRAQIAAASKNTADAAAAVVIRQQTIKTAADAAVIAIPYPQLDSIQAYNMTVVRLNERAVDVSGANTIIYIDSVVLARAIRGTTVGTVTYAPVSLAGVQVLGLGLPPVVKTYIVSASIEPSIPAGLYPGCVRLVVDKTGITVGDGIFYLVGGELLLKNFIF